MFDRPGFAPDSPQLRQLLLTIGEPGGLLDARDDLFGPHGGPMTLISDPASMWCIEAIRTTPPA